MQSENFPKKPVVVHLEKRYCDIIIDRRTKWGNPYKIDEYIITEEDAKILDDDSRIGQKINRDECIDLYKNYLQHNEELLKALPELDGKILGCWCKNADGTGKRCHGDAIVEVWLEQRNKNLFDY